MNKRDIDLRFALQIRNNTTFDTVSEVIWAANVEFSADCEMDRMDVMEVQEFSSCTYLKCLFTFNVFNSKCLWLQLVLNTKVTRNIVILKSMSVQELDAIQIVSDLASSVAFLELNLD